MKFFRLLAFSLALSPSLLGQGNLTPPGTPGPTMKSLQEVWDKISVLETTATEQRAQITQLQLQNTQIQQQNV